MLERTLCNGMEWKDVKSNGASYSKQGEFLLVHFNLMHIFAEDAKGPSASQGKEQNPVL